MGVDCCDKWADGSGRPALLHLREGGGGLERISFDDLKARTNRLANALRAHGIGRGDRVAVLLPQVPETAVAHLAAFKLGAVSVPLFRSEERRGGQGGRSRWSAYHLKKNITF